MAAAHRHPAPEPSRESLALAFRQLRRPDRWPATLDAALAHPTLGTCLRAMARNLSRPAWQPRQVVVGLPQGLPVPTTPTEPPASTRPAPSPQAQAQRRGPQLNDWKSRPITMGAPARDMKRAAANDRDD